MVRQLYNIKSNLFLAVVAILLTGQSLKVGAVDLSATTDFVRSSQYYWPGLAARTVTGAYPYFSNIPACIKDYYMVGISEDNDRHEIKFESDYITTTERVIGYRVYLHFSGCSGSEGPVTASLRDTYNPTGQVSLNFTAGFNDCAVSIPDTIELSGNYQDWIKGINVPFPFTATSGQASPVLTMTSAKIESVGGENVILMKEIGATLKILNFADAEPGRWTISPNNDTRILAQSLSPVPGVESTQLNVTLSCQ